MQRSTECGWPIPNKYIYITTPEPMAQGTSQKKGQKDNKRQNTPPPNKATMK